MSIAALTTAEVLAIVRLRQWTADRCALRSAKTTDYQRHGWRARNHRTTDARIVRVIDFERALAHLSAEEQAALLLTYRERQSSVDTARMMACSARKVAYLLPLARRHLADVLDRLDLL